MRTLVDTLGYGERPDLEGDRETGLSGDAGVFRIDDRAACLAGFNGTAPTLLIDRTASVVLACNGPAAALLGRDRGGLVGHAVAALFRVDGMPEASPCADAADPLQRLVYAKPDGTTLRFLRTLVPVDLRGRPASLMTLIDITAQDRIADESRQERDFLADVVQTIPAAIFVKDLHDDGRYVLCTRTNQDMCNIPSREVVGHHDRELFAPTSVDAFRRADERVLATGAMELSEATVCLGDGSIVVTETKKMVLPSAAAPPRYILGITEDITRRREMELRLARVAMLDPLTGLANRMLFRERLRASLKSRQQTGGLVVLHCLDLDQFKGVNDTLGHAAGDILLAEVGARIEAVCGTAHTVARLGGDEFAIIQGPIASLAEATDLANRVARSLSAPITIDGKSLVIGSSAGLAVAPLHGDEPDALARSADIALYGAKEQERGSYLVFDAEMATRIQTRHRLEEDIREALATEQFELFYQPIVDIRTNDISGFEALLRWQHPIRSFVPPSVIIPVAEESGLIVPLGEWVLREACKEAATWPEHHGISVNLSPLQFRNPGLASTVAATLADSGLCPSRLELEITESVLLTHNEANLNTLHELRDLGVRISLDDFGTGYSSLGYLSAFPFHKIKIDRSFVQDITSGSNCLAIVRSVIKLADDLGMTTTAEGVETREQLDRLRLEGCAQAQGYFFDQPQPAGSLPRLMEGFAARTMAAA